MILWSSFSSFIILLYRIWLLSFQTIVVATTPSTTSTTTTSYYQFRSKLWDIILLAHSAKGSDQQLSTLLYSTPLSLYSILYSCSPRVHFFPSPSSLSFSQCSDSGSSQVSIYVTPPPLSLSLSLSLVFSSCLLVVKESLIIDIGCLGLSSSTFVVVFLVCCCVVYTSGDDNLFIFLYIKIK